MAQGGDMNRWLIVHDLESFSENPKMIGFVGKRNLDGSPTLDSHGNPLPADAKALQIKPGDEVVYYCRGDSVIKGIYEIVQFNYGKETRWTESPFQFEIRPVIEPNEPYDFKPLVGSLDLFRDLPDPQRWGLKLRGIYNAIQRLTEGDYNTIKNALITAKETSAVEEDEAGPPKYRRHLHIQHKIAEVGIKRGLGVYVAINDKGTIKENLKEILDDIPKFHNEQILRIAKRIDVLFFDKKSNIPTHAFEVEDTSNISLALLRLNDIAEHYPVGAVQFIIVSDESNNDKFEIELERPSFSRLRENHCRFITFKQVEEEWKQLQNKKPPLF